MTVAFSDSHPTLYVWFMEEPSQFSVGQTAQSLTCYIIEKPHTGFKDCLNMLLSYFRKRMSALESPSPRKLWNVLNAVTSAMNDEDETNAVITI